MDNCFSVWFVPGKKDKEYLDKIIKDLANKYDSPIFIPHLTLFVDVKAGEENLKSTVDEIFANVKPFKIKKKGLNQSENFYKTAFIEFENNDYFKDLFNALSEKIEQRDFSTFKPHLSLIYKTLPEKERINIINSLDIKNEFTIGNVYINRNDPNDYPNVNGWKIIYKKTF